MLQLTYVVNELRRRAARTILTALGLAAGVGLVIGIIGVSRGLDDAQQDVLKPLTSIGTDVLVTRVAGADAGAAPQASQQPSPQASAAPGQAPRPGSFFAGGPGGANVAVNEADASALLAENSSVFTDLSKLGAPG